MTKLETITEYEQRTGKKYQSLFVAARNARAELKEAFPGVKFSVTTEHFAGGNAMRVSWTDGPTSQQVEEIVNQYAAGSFDGMQDIYEYHRDEFTQKYGSAKYVTTQRDYTPEFLGNVAEQAAAKYGLVAPKVEIYSGSQHAYFGPSDQYVGGSDGNYYWSMQQMCDRLARETSMLRRELVGTVDTSTAE